MSYLIATEEVLGIIRGFKTLKITMIGLKRLRFELKIVWEFRTRIFMGNSMLKGINWKLITLSLWNVLYQCVIEVLAAVDFKMCFGDDEIVIVSDTTSNIIAGGIGELLATLCCMCCQEDPLPPIQEQARHFDSVVKVYRCWFINF